MKKKGFTLVELLAVIVILAFVSLITIPIVLSVVNKSGDSATRRSAENYRKAVKESVAKQNLSGNKFYPTECYVIEEEENRGYLNCVLVGEDRNSPPSHLLVVKMEGTIPLSGTIRFEESEPVETTLYYKGAVVKIDSRGNSSLTKTSQ